MKLFTKAIDNQLFAQYSKGSDLESQKVVAKIFNPYGRGTWYIINSDPADPDYLWAIVDLLDVSIGSVSRSELETIKVPPFRLNLERDMSFTPRNAAELYKGLLSGKRYASGGTTDYESDVKLIQNEAGKNYLFQKDTSADTMGVEFAKGGYMAKGGIMMNLDNFDLKSLDKYEKMEFDRFSKNMSKAEALQIIINNVEGDYSQLSPKLAKLAESMDGMMA